MEGICFSYWSCRLCWVGSLFHCYNLIHFLLLTVCLPVASETLCGVRWCRHRCPDAGPGPWLSSSGGHPWASSRHAWEGQDWTGALQVGQAHTITWCHRQTWFICWFSIRIWQNNKKDWSKIYVKKNNLLLFAFLFI